MSWQAAMPDDWEPTTNGDKHPLGTVATGATGPNKPPEVPVEPPRIAYAPRILDEFVKAVRTHGVVGEDAIACTTYLAVTSRVLDKPVSLAIKGHSASGKSHTVQTTLEFFPDDARIEMTGMSERALIYMEDDVKHKTIVLYEAEGLRDSNDDNGTAYYVRSLLSEGKLRYRCAVQDKKNGGFTTQLYEKDGPTNLVFTTTRTQVHAENETRVLSLTTNDSPDQTRQVFRALADENRVGVDLTEWRQLQTWLQREAADSRVTIPFASQLAEAIEPSAVRLRRDFGAVLSLVHASAVLHQTTRDHDDAGRIIATLDDYETVRKLVNASLNEGVGSSVSPTVRETVEAVKTLGEQHKSGVTAQALGKKLKLDKSAARRRLLHASDHDYVRNLEDRRGQPGRWVIGEPLPDPKDVLPPPEALAIDGGTDSATAESLYTQSETATGGTVASVQEGVGESPANDAQEAVAQAEPEGFGKDTGPPMDPPPIRFILRGHGTPDEPKPPLDDIERRLRGKGEAGRLRFLKHDPRRRGF